VLARDAGEVGVARGKFGDGVGYICMVERFDDDDGPTLSGAF